MIIGVDPHKSSHTATAVDPATNTAVASLRVDASLAGYRELLRWATQFAGSALGGRGRTRVWAVIWRSGSSLASEVVFDVPSTATARVRELSRGSRRKTDVIDAAAAASVAALHGDATPVAGEDHTTVFALLEERRANLAAQRVRVANQLHAVLRDLVPGGAGVGDHREVGGDGAALDPARHRRRRRTRKELAHDLVRELRSGRRVAGRHRATDDRRARRTRHPPARRRRCRRDHGRPPDRPHRRRVTVPDRRRVRHLRRCRADRDRQRRTHPSSALAQRRPPAELGDPPRSR